MMAEPVISDTRRRDLRLARKTELSIWSDSYWVCYFMSIKN
ncbi:hypothetical protein D1AOALGA4SA_10843 [Olavius algarvensis Delta 1 endosymbiont]|nr:hypothetical protein D1AOALGA4SA_10843 [Olavius algarvensis Delta 1 endosymbiont]